MGMGIDADMGMDGMGAWAQGAVTLLARCEVLARAAWYSRPWSAPSSATALPDTRCLPESSRPCNGASADHQDRHKRLRFFHGRTAARRQMGKWAR